MRYPCWCCGKSVTSELPDDAVIRALLVCPECIEQRRVILPDDDPAAVERDTVRRALDALEDTDDPEEMLRNLETAKNTFDAAIARLKDRH